MSNTSENPNNEIDENIKTNNSLEHDNERTLSLNSLNETEPSQNNESVNEYIGYASNAYYYTGKSIPSLNIKAIILALVGIILISASTFFYFSNKNNLNPFIGFAIGILLLIIALIQFIYKKN